MEITRNVSGSLVELELNGKLDSNTAMLLEKEIDNVLVEENFYNLEINMAELTYLSSAGLRVILGAQKKLNSIEAHLTVTNANDNIKSVFEITGFLGIINIV